MFRLSIVFIMLFPVISCAGVVTDQKCLREEAIQAETEAATLNTASKLYTSYKRYAHCDDGAIAEGYSYSVVSILTKYWDSQIKDIKDLTSSDEGFKRFFFHHIDDLMSSEEQKLIISNARNRCPQNYRVFCELIEKAAIGDTQK